MKDDLSDSLEKFEEFEDFQRVNGQNITEYIAAFDSRYRKMEKFKIKLPSEILAFKLLRRANISKEEKMLVLTGMNYANRETLYEEAKQSLKKFKGDITEGSISTAASVKLEPAFLAENEEALLAAETLGLEEGLEASYYYREMLASILGVKPRTVMIEAYVDNKSIIEAILSTRLVEDKRLRVDVAAIKESLQLHDVKKIQWVPGHLQLANPMTKQGASGFNLLKVLQSGKMLDELC